MPFNHYELKHFSAAVSSNIRGAQVSRHFLKDSSRLISPIQQLIREKFNHFQDEAAENMQPSHYIMLQYLLNRF